MIKINDNIREIIINEYPNGGYKKISTILGVDYRTVKKIIIENNIVVSKNRRVNFSNFENIDKKEVAYFLGFFWSDGYISKNEITISIKSTDGEQILKVLNSFGDWRIDHITKKLRGKEYKQSCIRVNDKFIKEYLIENHYLDKSLTTPTKILSKISEDLKPYFFRGMIDGDGCFCSKNRSFFSITGNINQNWSEIEKLFNHLNIKYKITKKERSNGSSSYIVISNKKDIVKLGNYIYEDSYDNIGLLRKYKIYQEIKNRPVSKYSKFK